MECRGAGGAWVQGVEGVRLPVGMTTSFPWYTIPRTGLTTAAVPVR